jgi:hypothetical protein
MRTSILALLDAKRSLFNRAIAPGDDNAGESERAILNARARLYPAYKTRTLDRTQQGTVNDVPAGVCIGARVYSFKRGVTRAARVILAEHVVGLHAIDDQITALTARRKALLAEAWRRGRPLREVDLFPTDPDPAQPAPG